MLKQIKVMQAWLSRRSRQSRRRHPSGYILATVIGLSVVLAVGIASVSIRAAAERAGSFQSTTISLSQSAAEMGLARLYAALSNGPYQPLANIRYDLDANLINDWQEEIDSINTASSQEDQSVSTRGCGFTTTGAPAASLSSLTAGTVPISDAAGDVDIWWQLARYDPPSGTNPAVVVMRGGIGTSRSNPPNREAEIEKRYDSESQSIIGSAPGNAALWARSIDLGNNDVLSSDSSRGCANVYCVDCDANKGPNSTVEGAIIRLPEDSDVPEPKVWPTSGATAANGYYDRFTLPQPFGNPPVLRVSDFPNVDSNGFVNIRVNNVPPDLKVINNTCGGSGNNPARLPNNDVSGCKRVAIYFEGDITGSINQVFSDANNAPFLPYPENLVLYGLPSDDSRSQNLTLGGGGPKIQSAVIIGPKVRAGINGGPPRSRTDPDVYGPLYVGIWDRSNSNNAEIVVPFDMFERLDDLIPNSGNLPRFVSLRNPLSWRKGVS